MASRALIVALDLHVIVAGATMHPRTCCSQAAAPGSSRNSSGVMLRSPAMIQGPPYLAASSPAARRISRLRSVAPSTFHRYADMSSTPPLKTPSTQAAASFPGEAAGDMSKESRPSGGAIPMCLLAAIETPLQPLCPLPGTAGDPYIAQFSFMAACCRSAHFSPAAWCSWQHIAATSMCSVASSFFFG